MLAGPELRIDPAARRVTVADHELPLRSKEFDLLPRLGREPGVAVRRETLMADVWDAHWYGSTKTLDAPGPASASRDGSARRAEPVA